MKKMKFLAFMLSAAFLATTFTACEGDEEEGVITIKVTEKPETAIIGEEFTVSYTVESDKNLKSIDVRVNNKNVGEAITKFENKTQYIGKITYTAEEAGKLSFSIQVTDKDGALESKDFEIEAKEATAALGEWSEEVRLKRPEAEGFKAESSLINLKWTSNVDGSTIKVAAISGKVVLVDNADFETVESLKEAYDAGTQVADFQIKTDANYVAVNYITIIGDDYVLVKTSKAVTLKDGNNNAYFQYKK